MSLAAIAFDQSPVAMVMTDRDLRIVRTSARWRKEMAITTDVLGLDLDSVFPGWTGRRRAEFDACLRGETPAPIERPFNLPNGETPWIRVTLGPWRRPDRSVGGVLIHVEDITRDVEARERIERSEQRLKIAADIAKLLVYEMD